MREEKGFDAFDTFDLPNYNGISTAYFDGRSVEYNSLFWEHDHGGLKNLYDHHEIEKGKWTDCIVRTLSKK